MPQRHEIARPRGAERDAADEPLEVVDDLQHLAELAAVGGAKGELLDGVQPIADPLERAPAGAAATPRSIRPPIDVTVRSISLSSEPCGPPSLPATTSRCLSVIGSMSRQSADGPVGDRAHMGEVGLLRVAQVAIRPPAAWMAAGAAIEAEAVEARASSADRAAIAARPRARSSRRPSS